MSDEFPLQHLMFLVEGLYPECKTKEKKKNKAYEIHAKNRINGDMRLSKMFGRFPLPEAVLIELGKLIDEENIKQFTWILFSEIEGGASEEQVLEKLNQLKSDVA